MEVSGMPLILNMNLKFELCYVGQLYLLYWPLSPQYLGLEVSPLVPQALQKFYFSFLWYCLSYRLLLAEKVYSYLPG